jgi:hypothetical protein
MVSAQRDLEEKDLVVDVDEDGDKDGDGDVDVDVDVDARYPRILESGIMDVGERNYPLRFLPLVLIFRRFVVTFFQVKCAFPDPDARP